MWANLNPALIHMLWAGMTNADPFNRYWQYPKMLTLNGLATYTASPVQGMAV
jgi:hypothetical protein